MTKFKVLNLTVGETSEFVDSDGFIYGEVEKETAKKIHVYIHKAEKTVIFALSDVYDREEDETLD